MSAATTGAAPEVPSGSLLRKIVWHWRYDEKRELWIGWWTLVVFYNLYGLLFFAIARTQPPPKPSLDASEVVQWFADRGPGDAVSRITVPTLILHRSDDQLFSMGESPRSLSVA